MSHARVEVQDFIATVASGSTVAFIVVTNVACGTSPNLWKRSSSSFCSFLRIFTSGFCNQKLGEKLTIFREMDMIRNLWRCTWSGIVGSEHKCIWTTWHMQRRSNRKYIPNFLRSHHCQLRGRKFCFQWRLLQVINRESYVHYSLHRIHNIHFR